MNNKIGFKRRLILVLKDFIIFTLSMIVFLNLPGNTSVSLATSDEVDFINGYVGTGFTNKVNNPKYNESVSNAESIDPITGTVALRQSDITFPGRDGLDLEIARLYNSGDTDILAKRAAYAVHDYYRCYEYHWNRINGDWQLSSTIPRRKYANLDDALADYEYVYNFCLTQPYDSIVIYPDRFEVYVNLFCTTITAPVYEPEEVKGNEIRLSNYNVERYDLGDGWSFAFPSIEFADAGYMYYHDGNGGAFRMVSGSSGTYTLENYDAKDINITSATVSGTKKYYVDYNKQIKYTFNADGTIERINDRFGNRIKFEYVTRPVYNKVWPSYSTSNQKPFIKKITDSVGRKIEFEYENKIDSGQNGTIDLLSIYVTDPVTGTKKKVVDYEKKGIRSASNVGGTKAYEFNYPILDQVKRYEDDANVDLTRYAYDYLATDFDYWNKTTGNDNAAALLKKVLKETSATSYVYENAAQNLGNDGLCYEARCKQRYDVLNDRYYLDSATNSWVWNTGNEQKLNVKDFEYSPVSYTGYPNYTSESLIPDNTQVWSIEKESNGVSTKTIHSINNTLKRKRLYRVQKTFADGSYMYVCNDEFDSRFPTKPITVDRAYWDKNGTFYGQAYYVYYTYNAWGAVESETSPIIYYNYNNSDYKNKRKTTYEYEPNFRLLKKTTWWQNDNTQLYEENTYDSLGRLKTNRNAKGEIVTHDYSITSTPYTGEGTTFDAVTKETVKKALGGGREEKSEIYFTIANGSLPVKTIDYFSDAGGSKQKTVTMTYDMLLGLLKTETEQGSTTTYDYDLRGREKSVRLPDYTDIDGNTYEVTENYTYSSGYSWDYRETAAESYDGKEYNGIYGLTVDSETVYKCNGVEKKYNQSRNLYDAYGNLRLAKNYNTGTGRWIQASKNIFDNYPRLISSLDANGNRTSCNYDSNGEMSEVIDPYGNMYVTENVRKNFVAEYFVPSTEIEAYRQDPHYTNPNVRYLCESYFNSLSELLERRVAYKSANRQNPIQETYKYDIAGNVVGYVDPKGNTNEDNNTRTCSYDALNRLVKVKNALNQIVDINYNSGGEIESVYARENDAATGKTEIFTKHYTEDGKPDLKTADSAVKADNRYNELGLVSTSKFRSLNSTDYYYDQLNNTKKYEVFDISGANLLQRVSYLNNNPFGASEVRTSDNAMEGGLNDKITIGYSYDSQIASKQVDYTENGVVQSMLAANLYNDIGLNTRSTSTGFGNSYYTNYFFDKTRLDRVQLNGSSAPNTGDPASAKFTYNEDGKIDTVQYPVYADGAYLKTKYTYSTLGKVQSVSNTLGTKILSEESYEYDNNGNVTKVIQTVCTDGTSSTTTTTDYTYDKLDRLQTEKIVKDGITTNKAYTYDLLGNRAQTPAVYDFTVNEKDQVVSIPNADDANTSYYRYGQDGLRYEKSFDGKTFYYSYDIDGNLSKVNDGTSTDSFSWADGKVYAKKDGTDSQTYYYLYNGFGDVVQLIDSEGNIANSYTYDAWGNPIWKQETVSNPIRYRGYVYDDETGLYYLKARYYDPAYGRFLTEDTFEGEVKKLQSLNLYTYAENNPLKYYDSTGHFLDTIADIGFLAWDVIDLIKDPSSGANWLALGADAVCTVVPFATGGGRAVKLADKALEAAKNALKALNKADRIKAIGNGKVIMAYKSLKAIAKGTGLEVHHLIEKRFADTLGLKADDILSVAIDQKTHDKITQLFREKIKYNSFWDFLHPDRLTTSRATPQQIWEAIKEVYEDCGMEQYLDIIKEQIQKSSNVADKITFGN